MYLLMFQSYGGFVTAHALGHDIRAFNCGIAVAPVTDWRYYGEIMCPLISFELLLPCLGYYQNMI